MLYLTQDDIKAYLTPADQAALIDNAPAGTLDVVEADAIEEVSGYLRTRFDWPLIVGTTGGARNAKLVQVMCDVLIYHLHARCSPRTTPDLRVKRYDDAIEWLKDCTAGRIRPTLPLIVTDTPSNVARFTSRPLGQNYIE